MYENETYEEILERVLNRMPSTMDKRESSFLYNSSAPVAVELQNIYLALDNILNITFFDTADREGKLQRCRERGVDVAQFDATTSIVVVKVLPANIEIPLGTRFNHSDLNFIVTEKNEDGTYNAECETAGVIGNVTGDIIPVDYIELLESAEITSIFRWGEDEADETLIDEAYYNSLNSQAFGGNRADYIEKMKKIDGVGGVKLYSGAEWKGGGTVKIVFTTSSYTKPLDSFVDSVQTQVDPLQNQGAGYGFAPIGHIVTVAGVNEAAVNVSMDLVLQNNYTWEDISAYVDAAIDSYFEGLNAEWEYADNIIVRISQIETRILEIEGVLDISGTTLNGVESNITVDKDSIVIRGSVNART